MQPYFTIVILAIVLGLEPAAAFSQISTVEEQVKAVFLFNFAKFVEWPNTIFSDRETPFTFCLIGDGVRGALESTIKGETLSGRPLAVREVNATENIRSCQILFVSPSQSQRTSEILTAIGSAPVLTVGESPTFITSGGMVRFIRSANRLRFEINPANAERAALRVSSRLLRVADVVGAGAGKQ